MLHVALQQGLGEGFKELFQIYYNFGLIFVLLVNVPVILLARLTTDTWLHTRPVTFYFESSKEPDIFLRSWSRPNQNCMKSECLI